MKNLKLAQKIFVLSGITILVFCLTIGWVYQQTRTNLYEGKNSDVKHAVESLWGVINHYAALEKKGEIESAEARRLAREAVASSRYDGQNYFWINDLEPRMIMHPIKPELDGKVLAQSKDADGKALFVEMADVARDSGEGFVSYKWAKPGFSKPVAKTSFVKLVPEWGWVLGSGLYLDDVEAELSKIFYATLSVVALVTLSILALVLWVARGISRPMQKSIEMLQQIENGRLDIRLNLNQRDEVGQMASAMDRFADSLKNEIVTPLQQLANGDLTFSVTPRDESDLVRGALMKVGQDMNSLMAQIQGAGEQIASGSMQVSDAGESLSQGATEQASSLEEISSSMNELASQTRQNAEYATQADQLSRSARSSAQSGEDTMKQMVEAMGEINASGQCISKIIKVIDEIAFQTNLLALNAAVEAARAGQHGKGFAVVAEEVRNLAARSAKAAQETSELIESSVSKAENGARIAERTSRELQEIVKGISQVSDIIAEISAASNEQAQGISEINQGLSQIDQVTQLNTSNAEQSAAASQELSGQANHLREMLLRFRLKTQHSQPQQLTAPEYQHRSVSGDWGHGADENQDAGWGSSTGKILDRAQGL